MTGEEVLQYGIRPEQLTAWVIEAANAAEGLGISPADLVHGLAMMGAGASKLLAAPLSEAEKQERVRRVGSLLDHLIRLEPDPILRLQLVEEALIVETGVVCRLAKRTATEAPDV